MDSSDTVLLLSEDLESDDMFIFCPPVATKSNETEVPAMKDEMDSEDVLLANGNTNSAVSLAAEGQKQEEVLVSDAVTSCNGVDTLREEEKEELEEKLEAKEGVKEEAILPAPVRCKSEQEPSSLPTPSSPPPTPLLTLSTPSPIELMPYVSSPTPDSPPDESVPSPSVPAPSSPSIPDVPSTEETLVLDLTHEEDGSKLTGVPLLQSRLRALSRRTAAEGQTGIHSLYIFT